MPPTPIHGYLVLADISGFTSFVARTELDHAHEIISDLLEVIAREFRSLLTVVKFEGDAVFAYLSDARASRPETILELIERTYVSFRNRIQSSHRLSECSCKACGSIGRLDLKFFLHRGNFIVRIVDTTTDLIGNDVNLVHRLSKNSVTERTGWQGYALFTEGVRSALGLEAATLVGVQESYEHIGPVDVYVANLQDRYAELTEKRRHSLNDGPVHLTMTTSIQAPPSVVWNWLHDPAKRALTEGIDVQPIRRIGGRMKEGALNQCVHGREVVVEEIVGWKPFEYASIRSEAALGSLLMTYDLQATGDTTMLVQRFRLIPKVGLFRAFAGVMMKVVAKIFDMPALVWKVKECAEKEWSERSQESAGHRDNASQEEGHGRG